MNFWKNLGCKTCQPSKKRYDMGMSLTKSDLQAIKKLIDGSIDERVPAIIDERVPAIIDARVQPMFDKLEDRTFRRLVRLESRLIHRIDRFDERLAIQTEKGLQEIRDQVAKLNRLAGVA